MNYIGSKYTLNSFIEKTIKEILTLNHDKREWKELVFADLFAGTGVVGENFKKLGCTVISNDIQYYSYCKIRASILNNEDLKFKKLEKLYPELKDIKNKKEYVLEKLNSLERKKGFIYNNYCLGGTENKEFQRLYFSDENGMLCDSIRLEIEKLKKEDLITDNEYFYLISILIEGIDAVANTASVYGAFLKKLKKTALKPLILKPLEIISNNKNNKVYNQDVNELILEISGDILYLDPPYNHRQYSANYHLLETIAKYDNPIITGKTGLRNYKEQRSKYCLKKEAVKAFEELIKNAKFKYIFLSYNCEGIIPVEEIKKIMSKNGEYLSFEKNYKRFKADKTEARNHKKDSTIEYIHCLIKNNLN